jgi:hypothetical protein
MVIIQKRLQLTEPTFAVILQDTAIRYNRTYAHTQTFNKRLQETLIKYFLCQFTSFYDFFCFRLENKNTKIFSRDFFKFLLLTAKKGKTKIIDLFRI